jgi:hypothetical protein
MEWFLRRLAALLGPQAWLFEFGAAAVLILVAAGLWLFHPGLSLAVPGGLLLVGSLWAARASSRPPREE